MQRAFKSLNADVSKGINLELKEIADIVTAEGRSLFSSINSRTAGGFKPRLRGFARVEVAQNDRVEGVAGRLRFAPDATRPDPRPQQQGAGVDSGARLDDRASGRQKRILRGALCPHPPSG